jgi:hypothetical protein
VVDVAGRAYDDGFHLVRHITGNGGSASESVGKTAKLALPSRPAKCDNRGSP